MIPESSSPYDRALINKFRKRKRKDEALIQQPQRFESRERMTNPADSCAYITVWNGNQRVASGTGFLAFKEGDKGLIITAAHVLRTGHELPLSQKLPHKTVRGSVVLVELVGSRKVYSGTIVGFAAGDKPRADIGAIKIEGEIVEEPLVLQKELTEGTAVTAIGAVQSSPRSNDYNVLTSPGKALDIPDNNEKNFISTNLPATIGYSGGPLVNNEGEVVGLVTWIDTLDNNTARAVPSEDVADIVAGTIQFLK